MTQAPNGKNWESWILKIKKTDEVQDKNHTIQESWILERRNGCNEIFLNQKKQIWEWINEWKCKPKKKWWKTDDMEIL
jgi:hypothetical protein